MNAPPLTSRGAPVMKPASGVTRKPMAATMSSESPHQPTGMPANMPCDSDSGMAARSSGEQPRHPSPDRRLCRPRNRPRRNLGPSSQNSMTGSTPAHATRGWCIEGVGTGLEWRLAGCSIVTLSGREYQHQWQQFATDISRNLVHGGLRAAWGEELRRNGSSSTFSARCR